MVASGRFALVDKQTTQNAAATRVVEARGEASAVVIVAAAPQPTLPSPPSSPVRRVWAAEIVVIDAHQRASTRYALQGERKREILKLVAHKTQPQTLFDANARDKKPEKKATNVALEKH